MSCRKPSFGVARLTVLMAVLFLAVGCGADEGVEEARAHKDPPAEHAAAAVTEAEPDLDLVGAWLLEDMSGRGVVDMVQTTIEFDGSGGVYGGGGCNRFTGTYTFEDQTLAFGPLATTKMMCPEAVMDQEDRFLRALGGIGQVKMDGPFLLIFHEGSDEPLRFTETETEVEL